MTKKERMTVDEIYKKIGQKLFEHFDSDNWNEAVLRIMRVDSTVGFEGEYRDKANEVQDIEVTFGYTESKYIHELYAITTEGGSNKWNRLVFRLWPEGRFDIAFAWDQELHDELENL